MGTTYLVDTENNGGKRYADILEKGLKKNDRMVIVYSDNSPRQDFRCMELACRYPERVTLEHARCGSHDALDYQLDTLLGWLIREEPKCKYVILSDDRGFDSVCAFWKERKVDVRREGSGAGSGAVGNLEAFKAASPAAPGKESAAARLLKAKGLDKDFDAPGIAVIYSEPDHTKRLWMLNSTYGSQKAQAFFMSTTINERRKLLAS